MPPEIIRKIGNTYLENIGKKEGQLISILDMKKVLSQEEVDGLELLIGVSE